MGIEKESICPPTFLRVRSVPGPVLGAMHTATRTEIAPGPRVHSEPDTRANIFSGSCSLLGQRPMIRA